MPVDGDNVRQQVVDDLDPDDVTNIHIKAWSGPTVVDKDSCL